MRIFVLITLIAVVIFGIIFLLRGQILGTDNTSNQPSSGYNDFPAGEQDVTEIPDTSSARPFSDERLIQDVSTSQVSDEGLLKNTSSNDQYVIYYYRPTANLTISLYAEPLRLARLAAENQLRLLLQLSNDELCALNVAVTADRYVSEEFKNQNLGLSFCQNAVSLP